MPKNVLIVATIMLRKICMPKAGIKRREQIKFIVSMRKKMWKLTSLCSPEGNISVALSEEKDNVCFLFIPLTARFRRSAPSKFSWQTKIHRIKQATKDTLRRYIV